MGRNSDIYVSLVSYTHQVAAKGWFIAMVSTTVETDNPESEIKPGLDLLGPIRQKFVSVRHLCLIKISYRNCHYTFRFLIILSQQMTAYNRKFLFLSRTMQRLILRRHVWMYWIYLRGVLVRNLIFLRSSMNWAMKNNNLLFV